MNRNFILAGMLALASLASFSADAQQRRYSTGNPPPDAWCRELNDWGGNHRICSAYTYEQCMASRYSHTEFCYLNPIYDPRFRQRR